MGELFGYREFELGVGGFIGLSLSSGLFINCANSPRKQVALFPLRDIASSFRHDKTFISSRLAIQMNEKVISYLFTSCINVYLFGTSFTGLVK